MKKLPGANCVQGMRHQRAFTLIEMLVVIGIIGLLAAMIIPLSGVVARKRIISRTQADISNLELAINAYKAKKGVYPPDNPSQPAGAYTNQLFYELWGMVVQSPLNPNDPLYTNTFNAKETIDANLLTKFFGSGASLVGIVNSSADTNEIYNLIPRLSASAIQNINTSANPVWVFVCASPGPTNGLPISVSTGQPANVFRYVSSNPTNNTTYDLWVDVLIGGKTNRICNWSTEPIIVGQ